MPKCFFLFYQHISFHISHTAHASSGMPYKSCSFLLSHTVVCHAWFIPLISHCPCIKCMSYQRCSFLLSHTVACHACDTTVVHSSYLTCIKWRVIHVIPTLLLPLINLHICVMSMTNSFIWIQVSPYNHQS